MSRPSLPERLKRARIVQILLVYLGASWVVLQVTEVLQASLALPAWVTPVAVILLLVGLVIISATALVQSLPQTTAREEAGEVPTDWQIAPGEVVASLRAGRLPHLTWGRAVLGGILAFWFLFGLAGIYVFIGGGRPVFGPEEAGANEAAAGIAVLPFDVRGEGLDIWREGMVDLLAAGLDGVGGMRTIDSRTVLARWEETAGGGGPVDLDRALTAAGRTGARYSITGSAVALGPNVRLTADLYDLSDGSKVAQGAAEGPADSVLVLTDQLGLDLMRDFLAERGGEEVTTERLASLTTPSLPALRSYLEGEAHFRRGELTEAAASLEEAVEVDSTFAMALFRLYQTYGWLQTMTGETTRAYGERTARYLDRLTARDRAILKVDLAIGDNTIWSGDDAEELVRTYPDDPEAWNILGEAQLHRPGPVRGGLDRAREAFEKAVELSPDFAPYYYHTIELAVSFGDGERARALLERAAGLSPDAERLDGYRFMLWALIEAEDEGVAADSLRALRDAEWPGLRQFNLVSKAPPILGRYWRLTLRTSPDTDAPGRHAVVSRYSFAVGRQAEALERLGRLTGVGPWNYQAYELQMQGAEVPPEVVESQLGPGACLDRAHPSSFCTTAAAMYAAEVGRIDDARTQAETDRVLADSLRAEDQLAHSATHRALAIGLEGVVAWREGDLQLAYAKLDSAVRVGRNPMLTWRLAGLEEERGNDGRAIGALRVLTLDATWAPFAYLRIGELEERLGDRQEARAAYEMALSAWVDADPGFAPKARAEEGLRRLES
jgi:tetratricopeptide (TPR) repeat protein/TolB-like protein